MQCWCRCTGQKPWAENVFKTDIMLSRREGNNWRWAAFGSAIDKQNPRHDRASRKQIFCSRLSSRTLARTFHASPSPFSLICSRNSCSLVAPLHCERTSRADYVQLPATSLPWRSRVLYARWRFSMYLWIAMCMRAHLAHVAFEISNHSPNFLDTPLMFIIFINNHLQTNNT
jgi:hypothetical protein